MKQVVQTVYIVDDDEVVRSSLSRSLQLRGYSVKTYPCAADFLSDEEATVASCLVLDQEMPEISGLELQRILNARSIQLPIVFMTGIAGIPECVEAMKAGAVDFLQKPFSASDLSTIVDTAFETSQIRNESRPQKAGRMGRLKNLTDREKEIVQYWFQNHETTSSKDVARHFNISPRTVEHHRARIFEKLNVGSVFEILKLSSNEDLSEGPF